KSRWLWLWFTQICKHRRARGSSASRGDQLIFMSESREQQRLEGLYERLRLKLLDLSRINRMLNYSFGVRSQRYLQIVDDVLEGVYVKLVGDEARLRISFLPEPDSLPPEEKTDDFLAALEHAKVSDIDYLTQLDALEREGRDDEIELAR